MGSNLPPHRPPAAPGRCGLAVPGEVAGLRGGTQGQADGFLIIGQLQDEGAVGIGENSSKVQPGSKARPMPLPRDIFKIPLPPRHSRGYKRQRSCPSSPGGSPSGRPFSGRLPAGRPGKYSGRATPPDGPLELGERMRLTLSVVTARTPGWGDVQILLEPLMGPCRRWRHLQLLLGPVGPRRAAKGWPQR